MFARALISILVVLLAVLMWLHRGYRKQISAQGAVNKSIRAECDLLKRSERMAQAEILGLERMLEFAKLPHDVQDEIAIYVSAVDEENRVRLAAASQARKEEYWIYLRTNFPGWFSFKRCHCGGSMGEPAAGSSPRSRIRSGSDPLLHRKCNDCGSIEELAGDWDDLEFRRRHSY